MRDAVIVRDTAPPVVETVRAPPLPPAPVPQVIDVGPLEARAAAWDAADGLARSIPPLNREAAQAFAAWIAEVRRLPHGPRREVEVALLHALFAAWCDPRGRLTARRVAETRPAVSRAAPVFGWPREDAGIAASFPPSQAALMVQVLRDVLPPAPDDPALAMVPIGFRRSLPLQAGDARAFLERAPHALEAYEAMRRRGSSGRRLPVLALLAPHLWMLAHRRWGVALVVLAGLWSSLLLSQAALAHKGIPAVALGALSVLVWIATALAAALGADRVLVAAAARAARGAGRKGVYAPGDRAARLSKAGRRLGLWGWVMMAWWGAVVLLAPYLGPVVLVGSLFGLGSIER